MRSLAFLLLAACSSPTARTPALAAPAAPARSSLLPWTSPCRVPVEVHHQGADFDSRMSYVLETRYEGDTLRFARRELRLLELNGEDMTTPGQRDNAVGLLGSEHLVPDLLVAADGAVRAAPVDVTAVTERAGLSEAQRQTLTELHASAGDIFADVARESWLVTAGAWGDFVPGPDRKETRAVYRSEGPRQVTVRREQSAQRRLLRHTIEGGELLTIGWVRDILEHLLRGIDVEAPPVPLAEAFEGGHMSVSYEIEPPTGRPSQTRWSFDLAFQLRGLGDSDSTPDVWTSRFDWAHAEGCR